MKKLLLLILAIALVGCSKDEIEATPEPIANEPTCVECVEQWWEEIIVNGVKTVHKRGDVTLCIEDVTEINGIVNTNNGNTWFFIVKCP